MSPTTSTHFTASCKDTQAGPLGSLSRFWRTPFACFLRLSPQSGSDEESRPCALGPDRPLALAEKGCFWLKE